MSEYSLLIRLTSPFQLGCTKPCNTQYKSPEDTIMLVAV